MRLQYELIRFISKLVGMGTVKSAPAGTGPATSLHAYTVSGIQGEMLPLEHYKGKKMLLVNVASKCGFTPQYRELQRFYERYGDQVQVIGFPSNDFGEQEPGSHEDIVTFCQRNFGVSFPLTEKVAVTGKGKSPVYQWLTDPAANGWNDLPPKWNFTKYLVDEEGHLTHYFASAVSPFDKRLIKAATK